MCTAEQSDAAKSPPGPLAEKGGIRLRFIYEIVGQIGVVVHLLHVVAIFQGIDQADQFLGRIALHRRQVWGTMVTSAATQGISLPSMALLTSSKFPGRRSLQIVAVVTHIFRTGFQSELHQEIFIRGTLFNDKVSFFCRTSRPRIRFRPYCRRV